MSPAGPLAHPLIPSLAWTLLHFLWQGALVALLLASANSLLKKRQANARYAAACVALLLMLALPATTLWRLSKSRSASSAGATGPALALRSEVTKSAQPRAVRGSATAPSQPEITLGWMPRRPTPLAPWIVSGWMAGVLFLSVRFLGGWAAAARLTRRRTRPAREAMQQIVARLAARLRISRPVCLLESSLVRIPAAIGWWKPVILLPISAVAGLPAEELEALLAHELAHIRRHDYLINLLQTLTETLLFYHPAVWWASNCARRERENCCDDLAVAATGNAQIYARALVELETIQAAMPQLAVAASGGLLLRRIERLLPSSLAPGDRSSRWPAAVIALAALFILGSGGNIALVAGGSLDSAGGSTTADGRQSAPPAESESRGLAAGEASCDSEKNSGTDGDDSRGSDEAEACAEENDEEASASCDTAAQIEAGEETAAPEKGSSSRVSPAQLAALKTQGVTPQYLAQLRELGYARLSIQQILGLKVQGVTPSDIREFRSLGYDKLSVEDLLSLRVQGISPKYIGAMKAAGYASLSVEELLALKVQGINADYVRGLQSSGYRDLSVDELISMRIHAAGPEFIRELKSLGYEHLSVNQLVALRIHGATPAYVRDLRALGYEYLPANDLVTMRIHGVTIEDVRRMKSVSPEVSVNGLVNMRIHGRL